MERLYLHFLFLAVVCVAMGKLAGADGRSAVLWTAITFVAYFGVRQFLPPTWSALLLTALATLAALMALNALQRRPHQA